MFSTLQGAVVGRDGTEIERFPGFAKAGTPRLAEAAPCVSRSNTKYAQFVSRGSSETTLYIDVERGDPTRPGERNSGHGLKVGSSTIKVYLHLHLMTTGGSRAVLHGEYSAIVTGTTAIRVQSLDSSSWSYLEDGSKVFVPRCNRAHGLKWVDGYPVVIGESSFYAPESHLNTVVEKRAVSCWVGEDLLDWEDSGFLGVSYDGSISYPTTNTRWEYWGNPINSGDGLDYLNYVPAWIPNAPPLYNQYFDCPPRRKVNAHVCNGDLIIAVPGHGHCLTATIRGKGDHEPITKATRALGVPKGQWSRITQEGAGRGPGFVGWEAGKYVYISVAYKNRFTGEVGLPSKPHKVTFTTPSGGGNSVLVVFVVDPKYVMPECFGMSAIIYTTGTDGSASSGFYPIAEVTDFTTGSTGVNGTLCRVVIDKDIAENTSWKSFPRYPVIEQMPTGASCAVTVRGVTWYGGDISSNGPLNFEKIETLVQYGKSTLLDDDDSYVMVRSETGFYNKQIPPQWGQWSGGFRLSSGYQGSTARLRTDPDPNSSGNKIRLVESIVDPFVEAYPGSHHKVLNQWWRFEDGKYRNRKSITSAEPMELEMNVGQVLHSEVGHPGITPSINRALFDSVSGTDVRGMARSSQSVILCTESETYSISWGRSPLGAPASVVSDSHGSCTPNGMVEIPNGVAWLSREGPVILTRGSAPEFIGSKIKGIWDTLVSDSRHMMWNAVGVHDPDNSLVMWAVRTDSDKTADGSSETGPTSDWTRHDVDDRLSTETNDLIIAFNYKTGSFSTHRMPAGNDIVDLERMPDADGNWRIFALEEDNNIYQMDSRFVDHASDTTSHTSSAAAATGSASFSSGSITSSLISKDTYMFIRSSTGDLEWWGQAGADSGSGSVTLNPTGASSAATWTDTSVLESNATLMTLITPFSAFGVDKSAVNQITIIHDVENGASDYAYARVSVIEEDGSSYYVGGGRLSKDQWGTRLTDYRTVFDTGVGQHEHSQLKIEIISNCHVKVKDIVVEVQRIA
tara:strand:+ start:9624 stop:12677 length:3054 start_codon:yes stop_codon:yes gene_type:complete